MVQRKGWINLQGEESMPEAKSYVISKQVVWQAYQKVKANHGAAGVDGESIEAFEKDLQNNLYKIWNRMSSGSYFPPPVRVVEIPKASGGQRRLGIPMIRAYCTPYQKPWEWVSCRWRGLVCLRSCVFRLFACPPAYTTMLIVTTASSSA